QPQNLSDDGPGIFCRLIPRHPHLTPLSMETDRLLDDGYTIGRVAPCDVLLDRNYVSAKHCRVYMERDRDADKQTLYVVDLSANGTYVNGCELGRGSRTVLFHRDRLGFANPNDALPSDIALEYSVEFAGVASHPAAGQPNFDAQLLRTYDFKHEIGAGNFAKVWLAIHKQTGVACACKVIETKKHLFSTGLTKVFKREVNIMKQLRHPNIVPLHELHTDKDRIYIFMEYLEAGDLFAYLTDHGPFSESVCRPIFRQICGAVRYLHANGITHRDIKLDNILIKSSSSASGAPWVKIADFGLARAVGDGELMRTICGTPSYLAPEIICRGSSSTPYSKGVDIWALGVMLYALHLKSFPFNNQLNSSGPPNVTIESYTRAGDFFASSPAYAGLSEPLRDLLAGMLQIDPDQRMSIDAVILNPWTQTNDDGVPGLLYQPHSVWGSLTYKALGQETKSLGNGPPFGGPQIDLFRDSTVIGRSCKCHIQVPDIQVSSKHCEILFRNSLVYIRNMSRNSCCVNGKAVAKGETAILEEPYEFSLCLAELESCRGPQRGGDGDSSGDSQLNSNSGAKRKRSAVEPKYSFRISVLDKPWKQVWVSDQDVSAVADTKMLTEAVSMTQRQNEDKRLSGHPGQVPSEQDGLRGADMCGSEYALPTLPCLSPPLVLPVQAAHLSYLPFRGAKNVYEIDGSLVYDPGKEELDVLLAAKKPWVVLSVLDSEYPRVHVSGKAATFGRCLDCMFCFDEPCISQLHCAIELCDGDAQLFNKGSNGTFVNGRRIEGSALLKKGDEVVLLFDHIVSSADDKVWLGQRQVVDRHGYPVLIGYRVAQVAG
ncbi:serine/threonine protein kinase, partial [Coemansia sp. RSA 2598]